jgi:hypothetical protein
MLNSWAAADQVELITIPNTQVVAAVLEDMVRLILALPLALLIHMLSAQAAHHKTAVRSPTETQAGILHLP